MVAPRFPQLAGPHERVVAQRRPLLRAIAASICCLILLVPARHPPNAAPPIEAAPDDAAPRVGANAYRQATPGMLTRTIFSTSQAGHVAVEIVDLLVGPGQTADIPRAEFAALLEVQAGSPALRVDGKAVVALPGSVIGISEGQRIAIDNAGAERPFVARLIKLSVTEQ
jgi:hypothetical protein